MDLNRQEQERYLLLLEEKYRRQLQRQFYRLFPDEDQEFEGQLFHARKGYERHLEHFKAGSQYRERCFMAANRVGKTVSGGYETSCHLTGEYRNWWEGRRFDHAVRAWACGKTNETTRDILQFALLGEVTGSGAGKGFSGTGIIPGDRIGKITWKQGVSDLADTVKIRHNSGKDSLLGFKSYQQGRDSFEGVAQHVVWDDEEPPIDIYNEQLIRTATTGGLTIITFTPMEGMSETVLMFMPQDMRPE